MAMMYSSLAMFEGTRKYFRYNWKNGDGGGWKMDQSWRVAGENVLISSTRMPRPQDCGFAWC